MTSLSEMMKQFGEDFQAENGDSGNHGNQIRNLLGRYSGALYERRHQRRFMHLLCIFQEYRDKADWEREEDRERFLDRICARVPQELPDHLWEVVNSMPEMLKHFEELRRLCSFVELEEDADGVVRVVLDGKIKISIIADGDTCDVEITADVRVSASIDGEAEGMFAFIAAEVIGKAVCSDKATGSGVFILQLHAEATILSVDGQCHMDVLNKVVTETAVIGESIAGGVDSALVVQGGCNGDEDHQQMIVTEVVGHQEQGVYEDGTTYAGTGFASQQTVIGGRKMLHDTQEAVLSKYVHEILEKIGKEQKKNPTWISPMAENYMILAPNTMSTLLGM